MVVYINNASSITRRNSGLPQIFQRAQLLLQRKLLDSHQIYPRKQEGRFDHESISSSDRGQGGPAIGRQEGFRQHYRRSLRHRAVRQVAISFFVTFSEEKIVFNTACLFKVEYISGEEYQTYFDFELIYFSTKRKLSSEPTQVIKMDKIVDKRRIYINLYNSVNKFKRVLFDDSDYFSYSDMLFISESFGEKIRLQDYQLGEFFNSDIRIR